MAAEHVRSVRNFSKRQNRKFLERAWYAIFTDDDNWIQDEETEVYIWNPEPVDGESIQWIGDYVRDDGSRYAQGYGRVIWFLNGRSVQNDLGCYNHGKPNGKLKHILPDNRVFYTEWDNGKRIK